MQNDEFLLVLVAANYSMCHDQVNEANLSMSIPVDCYWYNLIDSITVLDDFLANGQQVEIEIEELKMSKTITNLSYTII